MANKNKECPGSKMDSTIILGNSISVMSELPPESVDMVFADPPYNLQLEGELRRPNNTKVDGVDNDWDKVGSFADYDSFTRAWLAGARRMLKDDGTLWVIGTYHNIYRVGAILQDMDFWFLNDVVWVKTNPMPNFRGSRFTNAHETLLWTAKSKKSKYTFNYEAMKRLNEDLQMRSDWLIPLCTGQERLRDDTGTKVHPTQKPESLIYRTILAATNPDDVVLDPFFGTGTTGAVAKKLGRRYVGIERDPDYVQTATQRLADIPTPRDLTLLETPSKRRQPRIPFGWLVERGLLSAGDLLVSPCKRHSAKVRADGTVISSTHRGSIHQVGAAVQGAPSCNGWTFWCMNVEGKTIPIDSLRQQLRAQLN
jgi:modification methylase